MRLRPFASLLLAIAGCDGDAAEPQEPPLAESDALPRVTDEGAVRLIVERVRKDHYPELDGVTILVEGFESESDFFTADLVIDTLKAPPRERTYRIRANKAMYARGIGNRATYAIVTHELKHVLDYVGMDESTLVKFGVDYVLKPQTEYERATDAYALSKGVGRGLRDFRRWLYAQVDDETRELKRRDYYTPEEIDAWLREHPGDDRMP